MKTYLHINKPRWSAQGSASLELVILTPFLLILMAFIWDVRAYTAYRTDMAREMYTIAELLAATGDDAWTDAQKIAAAENIVDAIVDRLDDSSVGWVRAMIVTRRQDVPGPPVVEAINSDGRDCDAAAAGADDPNTAWDDTTAPWCEPQLHREIRLATWGDQGACVDIPSRLPAQGDVFTTTQQVLPNENADPDGDGPETAPSHDQWVSRSLRDDEWWVVVESCSHFGRDANPDDNVSSPGLILPGIENISNDGLFFDARLTLYNRIAWGAVDALDKCHWEWCD